MGGKNLIASKILPTMLSVRRAGQWWVEPFVGSASVIEKVDGPRMGSDIHPYLIALLSAMQRGWVPPSEVGEAMYRDIKKNPHSHAMELVGFVGFGCSFGGKWWGGYGRNRRAGTCASEAASTLSKQAGALAGIVFSCGNYVDLAIPPNSLIYCDPPYQMTARYRDRFDSEMFWKWCRDKEAEGHTVFVSEYSAPDDFLCVKEILHKTILNKSRPMARMEKLFIHNRN